MGSCNLFRICKNDSDYTVHEGQSVRKLTGPRSDGLVQAGGYTYFTEEQEAAYEKMLASEEQRAEAPLSSQIQMSELIGQGSFGQVFFAVDMASGELLAVKWIPITGFEYETAHESISMVQEEVEILRKVRHRNIVRYVGSDRTKDHLRIFTEYMAGGSIAGLLHKFGRFNETLIRLYTFQILQGLEYLHSHKIIHGDIKGANVLISSDGACKLTDFGNAKKVIRNEHSANLSGTTSYMAPEVLRQDGSGRFADIWSLGCLVVEMATGRPPWSHLGRTLDIVHCVCEKDELPALPEDFSYLGKEFVAKCLRRNPAERPNVCELLLHPFISQELVLSIRVKRSLSKTDEDI